MKYPDFVARFYDVVYRHIRSLDHEFYVRRILSAKGPVLEVGVGTGRLFFEALTKGADVFGVDISPTMIGRLKAKLKPSERKRVSVQDVRQLAISKRFRLIIAPFRVLSHLNSTQDQLSALRRVRAHLAPGGIFLFDLFSPDLKMCAEGLAPTVDFDGEWETGKKLKRITSALPDPARQINHVSMRYVWEEDGKTVEKCWEFPMRYFFRYELEHLVKRAGFSRVRIYGDFQKNEPTRTTKEFVVECLK